MSEEFWLSTCWYKKSFHIHSTSCLSGRVDNVEVGLIRRNQPNIPMSTFQFRAKSQNSILSDDIAYCQQSYNVSFTPKTNYVIQLARACFFTFNKLCKSSCRLSWNQPPTTLLIQILNNEVHVEILSYRKSHVHNNLTKDFG